MPQRRRTAPEVKDELPSSAPAGTAELPLDLGPPDINEELEKTDFFSFLNNLDEATKKVSKVYIYRLLPRIEKSDGNRAIDVWPAAVFTENLLIERHGGGKYLLWIDSKLPAACLKRTIEVPGSAKIYPNHILVDDKGAAVPPAPPAQQQPVTASEIAQIVREVVSGMQNPGMAEAFRTSLEVVKEGAKAAVDMAKQPNPQPAAPADDNKVVKAIERLADRLQHAQPNEMGDIMKTVVAAVLPTMLKRLVDPPASASPFGMLKDLAALANDEGFTALRNLFGGAKEEPLWEKAMMTVAQGVGTAIQENGPAIVQAYRERTQLEHTRMVMQRQQPGQQTITVPPVPRPQPVTRPLQGTAQTVPRWAGGGDPQPGAAPQETAPPAQTLTPQQEQEAVNGVIEQIVQLIQRCDGDGQDGAATATVVKLAFQPILPMIRANFNNLEQLKQFARTMPQLQHLTSSEDFDLFAEEFFNALHDKPATAPPPKESA